MLNRKIERFEWIHIHIHIIYDFINKNIVKTLKFHESSVDFLFVRH